MCSPPVESRRGNRGTGERDHGRAVQPLVAGDRQAGIVVVVQAPRHVVAIQAVLLDPQHGSLVRVVAQPERVEQDLVEEVAVAVPGVHGQMAAEQPQAVADSSPTLRYIPRSPPTVLKR